MGMRLVLIRLPQRRLDEAMISRRAWLKLEDELYDDGSGRRETSSVGFEDMVGKGWDALCFLLDPARRDAHGQPPSTPGGAAVAGWHAIPALDLAEYDHHPPRYNTAAEVAEIAEALAAIDSDVLLDAHGAELASAIGYFKFSEDEWRDDETRVYVRQLIDVLRSFYEEAAQQSQAVVAHVG